MTMKEKMARALFEYQVNEDIVTWETLNPVMKRSWLRGMDAILDAMSEPTEVMIDAAEEHIPFKMVGASVASRIFTAMIDAAKQE